jgi:hypothetical protein
MIRVLLYGLFGAGALAPMLAGCGGNDADSTSRESPACSLVTEGNLESVGISVISGPTHQNNDANDVCTYETAPLGGSDALGRVTITIYSVDQAAALSPGMFSDSELLPGVGASAWFSKSTRTAVALAGDGRAVAVEVAADSSGSSRDALEFLLMRAIDTASTSSGDHPPDKTISSDP